MAASRAALFLVAPVLAALPSWQQPVLDPLKPFGGSTLIPNVSSTRVFYSTPVIGTYNHAVMLAQLDDQMIVMWKNSPTDEVRWSGVAFVCWDATQVAPQDEPGQRVLFSQSFDAVTWSPVTADSILFPSMNSSQSPRVALFAGPPLTIHGHLYAAASPTQYCLYPDFYQPLLLLRRVFTDAPAHFGE